MALSKFHFEKGYTTPPLAEKREKKTKNQKTLLDNYILFVRCLVSNLL